MTIYDILISTTITILPLGYLIPETDIRCGDVGGVYVDGKIYVCGFDSFTGFYAFHEIGHKVWNEILTKKQKQEYIKLYGKSKYKIQNDAEEDFCDVFSYLQLDQKQNINVQKRTNLIRSFLTQ